MHVCFIEDTHLHGGTQIWVTEATRHFLDAGLEVTVLTPANGWVGPKCAGIGARVVSYDFDGVVGEDDENQRIWAEALRDADVAVCTVHPPRKGFHCSVFAAGVIKRFGLRTILLPKTGTIVPEYKREFYLPDEQIRSAVIAITDFTREYLINTYRIPAEMTALIYQGTEIDLFTRSAARQAEAQKRYPLPENAAPILGNAGSFEDRKGQIILLQAMAEARKQMPAIHLMLVGDGPDEEKLKKAVREMNLEQNVTFFPFTPEPVFVFEVIDILVLSSLYKEGLPNVLLEAMSMELPVVASRLAGVPEVVQDGKTGYMVEPGDVPGLVDAIARLWTDQKAYEIMSRNARRLMETQFNKIQQFGAFIRYFQKITEER